MTGIGALVAARPRNQDRHDDPEKYVNLPIGARGPFPGRWRVTETAADTLRRRIALYRRYLREGVEVELAAEYLKTIAADEAALAAIEGEKRPRRSRPDRG